MAAEESRPRRLGIAALEERLGTERTTIWRWYSAGTFPAPHHLGRRRFWWLADVLAWEAKEMARAAPQPVCQAVAP